MIGTGFRTTLALLGLAAAASAAILLCLPETPGSPARPTVRRCGKLGPAAQLRLELKGEPCASAGGAQVVDLVLSVEPGADLPGSTLEFLLPRGWEILDGVAARSEDLVFGTVFRSTLKARLAPDAPRAVGARIRWGNLARETYLRLDDATNRGLTGGRLDRDAFGGAIRVFPAVERD